MSLRYLISVIQRNPLLSAWGRYQCNSLCLVLSVYWNKVLYNLVKKITTRKENSPLEVWCIDAFMTNLISLVWRNTLRYGEMDIDDSDMIYFSTRKYNHCKGINDNFFFKSLKQLLPWPNIDVSDFSPSVKRSMPVDTLHFSSSKIMYAAALVKQMKSHDCPFSDLKDYIAILAKWIITSWLIPC